MSKRTLDLSTRMAEREWKHHMKSPNTPMPVIADIRAELERLARRIKKLNRFAPGPVKRCHCQICSVHSHTLGAYLNRNDVLALLKQAKR